MKKTIFRFLISFLLIMTLSLAVSCLGNCSDDKDDRRDRDKNEHECDFGEWETAKEPTCEQTGEKRRQCKCGEVESEEIPKKNHTPADAVIENEEKATCKAGGSYDSVIYCSECGEHMETEHKTTPVSDHIFDDIREVNGFCGDRQISAVYCSVCGELGATYGHSYKKSVTNARCTLDGAVTYTCIYCGDSYSTYIKATGHISEYITETEPGCESCGKAIKLCLICGGITEEREISPNGHSYVSTANGKEIIFSCSVCSHSYIKETESPIHNVTFISDGSSILTLAIEDGATIDSFPAPEKNGYMLSYWATDESGSNPYVSCPVFASTSLYAIWEEETLVDSNYSDISVFNAVGTDFTFRIKASNEEAIRENLSIYSVSEKKLNYNVTDLENGYFEISSEEYLAGEHYYAIAEGDILFDGTESRKIQLSIAGENRADIIISDSAKWLDAKEIYAIIDTEGGKCLLTANDFEVGDSVAVYEKSEDNILIVISIKEKSEAMGYNAYTFDIADYDTVFEKLDVSISGNLSDAEFELNSELEEEIEEYFLSSKAYKDAKSAAVMLADEFDITVEYDKVKIKLSKTEDSVVIELNYSIKLTDGIKINLKWINEFNIDFNCRIDSISDYSVIISTASTASLQIEISAEYSFDEDEMLPNTADTKRYYDKMLSRYKEILKTTSNKDIFGDKAADPDEKSFYIAKIDIQVYVVTLTVDLEVKLDFEVSCTAGINASVTSKVDCGIVKGDFIKSFDIELTGLYFYGIGKLDTSLTLELEVFVNVMGVGVFGSIDIGPYLEIGIAGSFGYDGNKLFAPHGGYYIDSGIKSDFTLGLKGEMWGMKMFSIDFTIPVAKEQFSGMPIGNKEIYIDFLTKENDIEHTATCDKSQSVYLDSYIDTHIIYQDIEDMKSGTKMPDDIYFSIVSLSGYGSKIKLDGTRLIFDNIGEDVTVVIEIRFSDTISKRVTLSYKVTHVSGCNHHVCQNGYHTGGKATCTDKAICERCGLEYGEAPEGHIREKWSCSTCGELLESEGLEYTSLSDGSYAVSGIGSCKDTYIVIPTELYGKQITQIANEAFYNYSGKSAHIEGIMIPDTVTSIGRAAFYNCKNLKEILLPDSIEIILGSAFLACESITEINLSGVTSIESRLFECCYNLKTLTLSDSLEKIDKHAFRYCKSLTQITLPDTVTSIGEHAFDSCEMLTEIKLSDNITSIGKMAFLRCESLTSISLPDTLTRIEEYTFSFCTNLSEVVMGNNIQALGDGVFGNCASLKEITLPQRLTAIPYATFYECKNLKTVNLSSNIKSIEKNAFLLCSSLTDIVLPNSITSIGEFAFNQCKSLTHINIPENVTVINASTFSGCSRLESVTISKKVTKICDFAFYDCLSLSSVYYGGTESQWKSMSIGNENTNLKNATVNYNYAGN